MQIGPRQHAGGQGEQRHTRQASILADQLGLDAERARQRGIADDQALYAPVDAGIDHRPQPVIGQIGRHFHEDRWLVRHLGDGAQYRPQPVLGLQVAQTRCVGGRYVDRHVIRERPDGGDQRGIIALRVGAVLVDADIGPKDGGPFGEGFQIGPISVEPAIVETHAIDHRAIRLQSVEPRLGIARLRPGRHGTRFDKPEAQPHQRGRCDSVLVEAGREPDRVGEPEAQHVHRQYRIVGRPRCAPGQPPAQRFERQVVRRLRVHPAQQRQKQGGDAVGHDSFLMPTLARPWKPGSALARRPVVDPGERATHEHGPVAVGQSLGDFESLDALAIGQHFDRTRPVGAP